MNKPTASFGPPKDLRPKFRFRVDLVPDGLVTTPQFVLAADHDDAIEKLHDKMGIVPFKIDGQPLQVGS